MFILNYLEKIKCQRNHGAVENIPADLAHRSDNEGYTSAVLAPTVFGRVWRLLQREIARLIRREEGQFAVKQGLIACRPGWLRSPR